MVLRNMLQGLTLQRSGRLEVRREYPRTTPSPRRGAAMTEQQLLALEPDLACFLRTFLFCCDYTQTFDHLGTCVRGLLSDLPRKTAEPIALQAGTAARTMQEFLKDHV